MSLKIEEHGEIMIRTVNEGVTGSQYISGHIDGRTVFMISDKTFSLKGNNQWNVFSSDTMFDSDFNKSRLKHDCISLAWSKFDEITGGSDFSRNLQTGHIDLSVNIGESAIKYPKLMFKDDSILFKDIVCAVDRSVKRNIKNAELLINED